MLSIPRTPGEPHVSRPRGAHSVVMNVSVCLSTPSCLPPSLVTSLSVTSDTELTPESLIQQKLPDTVPGNIAGSQMIPWGTGQCWEGETASGEWRAYAQHNQRPGESAGLGG